MGNEVEELTGPFADCGRIESGLTLGGCDKEVAKEIAFRCSDCLAWFHRDCINAHFKEDAYVKKLRELNEQGAIDDWKKEVAEAKEKYQSLLKFFGATEAADGSIAIDMPKYHKAFAEHARASTSSPLTAENSELQTLAREALAETRDCDDCEAVAVWERSDDPETHWHSPSVVAVATVNPMEPHVFQRTLWNVACCAICNGAADGKLHQMRSPDFNIATLSSSAEIARRIKEYADECVGNDVTIDAGRIESELAATSIETDWQPIESAPKMTTVLLWADTSTPGCPNWRMGSGFFHTNMNVWVWEGEQVRDWAFPPTRWAPLPPPPESEKP